MLNKIFRTVTVWHLTNTDNSDIFQANLGKHHRMKLDWKKRIWGFSIWIVSLLEIMTFSKISIQTTKVLERQGEVYILLHADSKSEYFYNVDIKGNFIT